MFHIIQIIILVDIIKNVKTCIIEEETRTKYTSTYDAFYNIIFSIR